MQVSPHFYTTRTWCIIRIHPIWNGTWYLQKKQQMLLKMPLHPHSTCGWFSTSVFLGVFKCFNLQLFYYTFLQMRNLKSVKNLCICGLTFNCFNRQWYTLYWRKCNDIQSSASVFKKLQYYNKWSSSAYNHLMCCQELSVTQESLKMVSVDIKTYQNSN